MDINEIDVSFLLCGLEDYRSQVECIRSISTSYTYEIVVCSNHLYSEYEEVITFTKAAFNQAYQQSKGKYIIILTSVIVPPNNVYDLITELKRQEAQKDKLAITSMSDSYGAICWIPYWVSDYLNIDISTRPQILRWPAFSRKTIETYMDGVIFANCFKHHYMDNWLGTFAYLLGDPKTQLNHVRIKDVPHNSRNEHDEWDHKAYKALCYYNKLLKKTQKKISYNLKNMKELINTNKE